MWAKLKAHFYIFITCPQFLQPVKIWEILIFICTIYKKWQIIWNGFVFFNNVVFVCMFVWAFCLWPPSSFYKHTNMKSYRAHFYDISAYKHAFLLMFSTVHGSFCTALYTTYKLILPSFKTSSLFMKPVKQPQDQLCLCSFNRFADLTFTIKPQILQTLFDSGIVMKLLSYLSFYPHIE